MNKSRRKSIDALRDRLEEIKAELEALQADEQDAYDRLPDSLQSGDKGSAIEASADALQEAVDAIDEVTGHLETAVA